MHRKSKVSTIFMVGLMLVSFQEVWANNLEEYKQMFAQMEVDARGKIKEFNKSNLGVKTRQHISKWQGTIDKLQKTVQKSKDKHKNSLSKLKADIDKHKEAHKQTVKTLKTQAVKLLKKPKGKSNTSTNIEGMGTKDVFVFVSSSIKKKHLIELSRQAKKHDGTLVLRGFINDSLLETAVFFKEIVEKSDSGVVIDPELFKEYGILKVPSFVVAQRDVYDKLSGNVSLDYAISKIKADGEVFKNVKK